jgi:hypothetical protein
VPAQPLLRGEVGIQRVAEEHMRKTVLPRCDQEGRNDLSCNRTVECMHELHMRRTRHACQGLHIKGASHHAGKLQEMLAGERQRVQT